MPERKFSANVVNLLISIWVTFDDNSKSDQEDSGFSVSYTMGSMSLTAAANASDNVGGTSGTDDTHKEIGLAFAF